MTCTRLIRLSLALLLCLPIASDVGAHCTPVTADVVGGRLTLTSGVADEVGFAPLMVLNESTDCGFESAPTNRLITDVPGYDVAGIAANSGLFLNPVLRTPSAMEVGDARWLWYWDPATEEVSISSFNLPLRVRSQRAFGELQLFQDDDLTLAPLRIAEPLSSDVGQHVHFVRYQFDGVMEPLSGAYGFFVELSSPGRGTTEPVLIMLNNSLSPDRLLQAAFDINYAAGSGDFDHDVTFTCRDVDVLAGAILSQNGDLRFDLNGDLELTLADLDAWRAKAGYVMLESQQPFLPADVNLDGAVDGTDFNVLNVNKFKRSPTWCEGDLNVDGMIDAADFAVWDSWRFQSSAEVAARAVLPEPSGAALVVAAGLLACGRWRKP